MSAFHCKKPKYLLRHCGRREAAQAKAEETILVPLPEEMTRAKIDWMRKMVGLPPAEWRRP